MGGGRRVAHRRPITDVSTVDTYQLLHISGSSVIRFGMTDNTDPMSAFTDLADKIKRAAYAEGWRDAMNAVAKAVGELTPSEVQDVIGPVAQMKTINGTVNSAKSKLTVGTTPYFIVRALEAKPGLTPGEIIQTLHDGGHAAPENSIRTNIHRLKERKLIVARHGKWFVV